MALRVGIYSSSVLSGVLQGSIMGALIFQIYIDDITDVQLSVGSNLVLHADDILLYHPVCTISDYSALQPDIYGLIAWAQENAMSFNPAKCKFMKITRKKIVISQSLFKWNHT